MTGSRFDTSRILLLLLYFIVYPLGIFKVAAVISTGKMPLTLFMPRSPLSAHSTGLVEGMQLGPEVSWLMGSSLAGTGVR